MKKSNNKWYEEISNFWFSDSPYLYNFVSRISFKERKNFKTIGIWTSKDGKIHIVYDPEFINKLTLEQKEGALLHEIMHIIFLFDSRVEGLNHRMFNIAQDICINEEIIKSRIGLRKLDLPENVCYLASIPDYEDRLVSEELYRYFMKKENEKRKKLKPFDSHEWLDDLENMSDEELYDVFSQIEHMVESSKKFDIGNISNNMETLIDQLTKPKISWKVKLKTKVDNSMSRSKKQRHKVWTRKNKKSNYLQGSIKRSNKLTVVVDTSMSIFNELENLREFYSEINFLAAKYEIEIIEFDTEIKKVEKFQLNKPIKSKGGGGTSISPVMEHLHKSKIKNTVIVFTDGFLDENIEYYGLDIVWVLNNDNKMKYGTTINM